MTMIFKLRKRINLHPDFLTYLAFTTDCFVSQICTFTKFSGFCLEGTRGTTLSKVERRKTLTGLFCLTKTSFTET